MTEHTIDLTLRVNGASHRLRVDSRVTLLDALRDRLGLTGTKKGCDQGAVPADHDRAAAVMLGGPR